jgi:arylsulfatase A-like enzyme
MPQLRSLIIDRGATLSQFVYNQALCCPSRATMLRGQYSQNTGVTTNGGPNGGYGAFYRKGNESSTLGTWFDAAGYTTGYFGKYLNGYPTAAGVPNSHVPPGWDRWFGTFEDANKGFNYTANDNGTVRTFGSASTDYVTDVLAAKATTFIRQETAPFLLIVAPNVPHTPSTPAPRHAGAFSGARYPRSPSFNEADVSDKPSAIKSLPALTPTAISRIDAQYRKRLTSLLAVDEMVRGIVGALEARNLLANTYLVFASDNGYFQGEHRIPDGKDRPYEEAITTPLYIRGPGIPAASVVGALVGNVDVPITFADAADITPPAFVDGRSFLPIVQGSSIPWRQSYLLGAGGSGGFAGIRTSRYTYVEYFSGEGEFYDRSVDPYQLVNTYASMDARLKSALHDQLLALKKCSGSACRSIEAQPLP